MEEYQMKWRTNQDQMDSLVEILLNAGWSQAQIAIGYKGGIGRHITRPDIVLLRENKQPLAVIKGFFNDCSCLLQTYFFHVSGRKISITVYISSLPNSMQKINTHLQG